MLRHSRLTFVSILLLLALIVPTNVVQAAQATPQAPADLSVAPDANLAVPDEVAQVVKSHESLTADQLSKIHAVLDSHKAEFQEVNNALTALESPPSAQDKKLFLPLLNAGGDAQSQAAAAQSASAPTARSAEKAGQLRQITVRLLALQDKVDQEVKGLLTASQNEVYAKQAAKLQSTGQAMAAKLQAATGSPEGAESTTDCFYGAYYNAYANYYSWLEYYYGYYDYYYYGNTYAYYDYLYAYYAYYYVNAALPYSGGAYFDAAYGFGYDRGSLSDTAYSYLGYAYYYGYYAYYYGYYSYYYYGSSYAYYSYYYGYYYAYPYEYYAKYYENLC